eukprot:5817834-Pleurochrysis_carterae.AAC.1
MKGIETVGRVKLLCWQEMCVNTEAIGVFKKRAKLFIHPLACAMNPKGFTWEKMQLDQNGD